ncbi:MAG TPA: (2Fe-2S)-binding protein, partial [Trebonia sp.]|nr:(2Fe-2S)-binding protein [Trebonia sp.]
RGAEALATLVRRGEAVDDALATLAASLEAGPAELADDAQVCNCNGVCKGDIMRAVTEDGASTPREVMAMTRAGTGCGSCKAMIVDIVALAAGGEVADEPAYLCPCRRQTREDLAAVIREQGLTSVSEVSGACGTGRECGACKPALAYLVSEVNANRHREERDARFINDRVHANIQKDGTFSVVPRMHGGVTTPAELRRIADVAEKYEIPLVKVTGGQRLDLLGVRKQDLPRVWEELGMPSGHAYGKAVRTVKSCVGTNWCRFGVQDSTGLAIDLEMRYRGLRSPHKLKMAVSGCVRECAEAQCKDVGVIATERGWNLWVAGNGGARPRHADLLASDVDTATLIRLIDRFVMFYIRTADRLQRTATWLDSLEGGIEYLRRVVVDDSLGLADELEAQMSRHVKRYRCEWAETLEDPVRLRRFRTYVNAPA